MNKLSFLLILILPLLFSDCSSKEKKSSETRLFSDDFETAKERVEELKKHISEYSEFSDAQFELFNVNGNFSNERLTVPGASSWDYQFVLKVEHHNIDTWISEMNLINKTTHKDSLQWLDNLNNKLIHKIADNELGEYYEKKGDWNCAIVFRQSQLIFRRIMNN